VEAPKLFCAFQEDEVERSIADRFERQVIAYPGRIAVRTRRDALTYDTLNHAANRVAWALLKEGKREDPVALLFENGASFIAASLGAVKAARVQIPLETSFPTARLRYTLEHSQAGVLVTNTAHRALASDLGARRVINVDELDGASTIVNPDARPTSETIVAIGYTSGSTGQPKGIVWNQRGILHAVMRHVNTYRISADDRVLVSRASLRVFLHTLLNGAAAYPITLREEEPADLADWLMREQVTVFRAAASAFRSFASSLTGASQFPCLRLILLFGEPVYHSDVELYRKRFADHCILGSSLGCNEYDDYACFFVDKRMPLTTGVLPGGFPMPGAEILLLDDDGRPVGTDQIGEIVIRSRYNAVGYWRRSDLTEAAFFPDPAGGDARLYRTGDMGRMGSDGCLFHVGRKDFQVKIRGHRVEITEVEAALLEIAGVQEAAVVDREALPGDKQLVAYVVPTDLPLRPGDLRRLLAEKLPDYMVPSSFVMLERLPLTATGKVDRRALPPPGGTRPAQGTPFEAPRSAVEERLAAVWAEVLAVDRVGVHDEFLELGGNSLLAAKVISQVLAQFRVVLPFRTFFAAPTVREMAAAIDRARSRDGLMEFECGQEVNGRAGP
jgi:amino acid adenylation domain-containing protein